MTHYLPYIKSDSNTFLPVPGKSGYFVNPAEGTVYRDGKPIALKPHRAACRTYQRCTGGLVHRLIMSAYLGRDLETHEQVCHLDGNTFNNRIENLVLGTAKTNALDKIATNTNGRKLRNQDVREIRFLSRTMTKQQIAKRFRISTVHVYNILARRGWANLPL